MDISKITQAQILQEPLRVKQDKERDEQKGSKEDTVTLSPEAMERFKTDELKRTEAIQQRIDSGFYFSKEVTEKVADEMLRRFLQ
jgi:anti-sigma28 factor (negative regulator of flagellin synthesis)